MPLHLLGKKSWNVYNAANRERVARDEALAEAAARDNERERKDRDSEVTIGLLRDRVDTEDSTKLSEQDKLLVEATKNLRDAKKDNRKRKRLPGEDDTDRDLRYAKEKSDKQHSDPDKAIVRLRSSKSETADAPLMDTRGNINLFPEDKPHVEKNLRQSEKAREKKRQEEAEENHGMPLSNALGRKGPNGAWYLDKDGSVKDVVGRDVWGNEDPRRYERQAQRITTSDPLAFMKQAQRQLKEVQRERKEREEELEDLRSRKDRDMVDLESFSLDAPAQNEPRRDHRHRHDRDDHRSRSRHHHRHRDRSKSRNRDSRYQKERRRRSKSPRRRRVHSPN